MMSFGTDGEFIEEYFNEDERETVKKNIFVYGEEKAKEYADSQGKAYGVAKDKMEIGENGFDIGKKQVTFAGFIKNKDSKTTVFGPGVKAKLLDKKGEVITETIYKLGFVKPGDTRPFSGSLPILKGSKPDKVEFEIMGGMEDEYVENYLGFDDFQVDGINKLKTDNGLSVSGNYNNKSEVEATGVEIFVMGKKDGKPVTGAKQNWFDVVYPKVQQAFAVDLPTDKKIEDVEVYIYESSPKGQDMSTQPIQ